MHADNHRGWPVGCLEYRPPRRDQLAITHVLEPAVTSNSDVVFCLLWTVDKPARWRRRCRDPPAMTASDERQHNAGTTAILVGWVCTSRESSTSSSAPAPASSGYCDWCDRSSGIGRHRAPSGTCATW